jgi:hypothetical protein
MDPRTFGTVNRGAQIPAMRELPGTLPRRLLNRFSKTLLRTAAFYPSSGPGAATGALLTRINALGCITTGTKMLVGANAVEQRFDTGCGKSDR